MCSPAHGIGNESNRFEGQGKANGRPTGSPPLLEDTRVPGGREKGEYGKPAVVVRTLGGVYESFVGENKGAGNGEPGKGDGRARAERGCSGGHAAGTRKRKSRKRHGRGIPLLAL